MTHKPWNWPKYSNYYHLKFLDNFLLIALRADCWVPYLHSHFKISSFLEQGWWMASFRKTISSSFQCYKSCPDESSFSRWTSWNCGKSSFSQVSSASTRGKEMDTGFFSLWLIHNKTLILNNYINHPLKRGTKKTLGKL